MGHQNTEPEEKKQNIENEEIIKDQLKQLCTRFRNITNDQFMGKLDCIYQQAPPSVNMEVYQQLRIQSIKDQVTHVQRLQRKKKDEYMTQEQLSKYIDDIFLVNPPKQYITREEYDIFLVESLSKIENEEEEDLKKQQKKEGQIELEQYQQQ